MIVAIGAAVFGLIATIFGIKTISDKQLAAAAAAYVPPVPTPYGQPMNNSYGQPVQPSNQAAPAPVASDWRCSCGANNPAGQRFCTNCGANNPNA